MYIWCFVFSLLIFGKMAKHSHSVSHAFRYDSNALTHYYAHRNNSQEPLCSCTQRTARRTTNDWQTFHNKQTSCSTRSANGWWRQHAYMLTHASSSHALGRSNRGLRFLLSIRCTAAPVEPRYRSQGRAPERLPPYQPNPPRCTVILFTCKVSSIATQSSSEEAIH